MQFVMNWLRNLGLILIIGIGIYIIFPDMTRQVIELYGMLFGPLIFVMLLVFSLPRKGRSRR
jgi:hypothetical protein